MHRPPLPPGNIYFTHFCKRMSHPPDHSAAGRIMSMKTSNRDSNPRTSGLNQPRQRVPPIKASTLKTIFILFASCSSITPRHNDYTYIQILKRNSLKKPTNPYQESLDTSGSLRAFQVSKNSTTYKKEMICTRIAFVQFIILKSSLFERFKFTQARAHIHTYTHKTNNMPSLLWKTGVKF